MRTVMPPTPEIEAVASTLDRTIGRFLESRSTIPILGDYEADSESLNLTYLVIRNAEGIVLAAREDLVLLPAALSMARSALEIGARALWLLWPEDPFDREARWLAHLRTEASFYERLAKRLGSMNVESDKAWERARQLRSFEERVLSRMPRGYTPPAQVPSFDQVLESVESAPYYLAYMELSQFVHGTHASTWLYRRNLGTLKQRGEYITPAQWELPFGVCWYTLALLGTRLLERLGGTPQAFVTPDSQRLALDALGALKQSHS